MKIRCPLCGKLIEDKEENYTIMFTSHTLEEAYHVCGNCFWEAYKNMEECVEMEDRIRIREQVQKNEQGMETDGKRHS